MYQKIQKHNHTLSAKEHENIIKAIHDFLQQQTKLSFQKKMKLFCYYVSKGTSKKLIFYINPRKNEVIFGIGHRGTDILERYPLLKSLADETKQSVMKFSIKKIEDIEKKAIKKIIEMILKDYNIEG